MSEDLSTLTLIELLDRLEPVPEPVPVSLWPQTAGWIWLGLAATVCAVWLIRRWIKYRRVNAYRRAALRGLAAAGNDRAAVAAILRRTALAGFPRSQVASLYGDDWLAFLDRTYDGTGFAEGPGRNISMAPYSLANESVDLAPLAADWVRRHRRSRASSP